MSKLTLNNVGNLIDATTAATVINDNSAAIVAAIDNTLSRDGTTPNQMGSDLDMNSNRILNLPAPEDDTDVVRKGDVAGLVEDIKQGPPGPQGIPGTNGIDGADGIGVPSGGVSGNVLKKNSSTDYDTAWGMAAVSAEAPISLDGAGKITWNGGNLTRTNDTNITLTLTGDGSLALAKTVDLGLGWNGTLDVSRGGTGGGTASGTLLDNVSGFSSTGSLVRTGAGTYAFRTLTGPANGISISNGSGVSGDPTLALTNDLAAVEGLGTTGIVRRTATDTWSAGTAVSLTSEVTGTLPVANGGTGDTGTAWTAWTPTVSSGGGTVTGATITTTAKYKNIGKTVLWKISCTLTDIGTGSPTGATIFTYPPGLVPVDAYTAASAYHVNTALVATGFMSSSGGASCYKADGTTLWANGNIFTLSGVYEAT